VSCMKGSGKWRDLLLVGILAIIAGATEGLVYNEAPNPYIYWLLGGIGVSIVAYFAFDDSGILAAATIPFFIVIQDATSYLIMTGGEFPPTWYPNYFPESFLWESAPILNVPNFYILFLATSLVVFAIFKRRRGPPITDKIL